MLIIHPNLFLVFLHCFVIPPLKTRIFLPLSTIQVKGPLSDLRTMKLQHSPWGRFIESYSNQMLLILVLVSFNQEARMQQEISFIHSRKELLLLIMKQMYMMKILKLKQV
jgi:hypothetical protein